MGPDGYHQLLKVNSVSLNEKEKKSSNRECLHKDQTIGKP